MLTQILLSVVIKKKKKKRTEMLGNIELEIEMFPRRLRCISLKGKFLPQILNKVLISVSLGPRMTVQDQHWTLSTETKVIFPSILFTEHTRLSCLCVKSPGCRAWGRAVWEGKRLDGQRCAYFQFLSCSGKQPEGMRHNKPSELL